MLDIGLANHFFEGIGKIFHNQDRFCARVFQLVFKFARRVERVAIDDHQPRPQDAENGNRILQYVGHHDRNAVTLL